MENVLICPHCLNENLQLTEVLHLECPKCETKFLKNSNTFFFDFRSHPPGQSRGLLAEQEIEFYSNDIFKDFVIENTSKKYVEMIKLLDPKVILDIGCGDGALAEELNGLYSFYVGYEPSDISKGTGHSFLHSDNVFLFHNDLDKKLPVRDQTVDLLLFLGSYDHIPIPEVVVRDAWAKLKPEGHLVIIMSNYAFWVKNIINFLSGKELFKNEHEHYCVHSPESLKKEILSFIPEARLEMIYADDLYIPNLPKRISFFYFNYWWLGILHRGLKFMINSVLRMKHQGSTMTLVFKK